MSRPVPNCPFVDSVLIAAISLETSIYVLRPETSKFDETELLNTYKLASVTTTLYW